MKCWAASTRSVRSRGAGCFGQHEVIDLVGVEDGGRLGDEDRVGFRFTAVGIDAVDIEVFVEGDERGFLALADLGAEFGPLAASAPDAAGVIAEWAASPIKW